MRGTTFGRQAVAALAIGLAAGLGGCALPHVLPVEQGTTSSGPSPYGVWYEQHWATNSVLLAAADEPNAETESAADDTTVDTAVAAEAEANAAAAAADSDAAAAAAVDNMATSVEASAAAAEKAASAAEDFDNSTPYQFPASSLAQPAPAAGDTAPADAAPSGDPIRY
jgi:hypothetical protein